MKSRASEQRRRQNREDARRAILDATEQLLVAEGYAGFSIRKLVSRCGYSAPSIYHHFRDKTGLIDALLEERFALLVVQLRRVACHADPLDNLREMAIAFGRFGLRNPTHYWLLTTPREDDAEPPASAEAARQLFDETLEALHGASRLRNGDLETTQQAVWATLHGVVSLQTSRLDVEWSKTLLETALDAVLESLISGASPDRSENDLPRPASPVAPATRIMES